MNAKTIAIAATLYFAIFLFAHRSAPTRPEPMFSSVHDLSNYYHSGKTRQLSNTSVTAPAGLSVDQITPDRFIVPLVVLNSEKPQRILDLNDIAQYERVHGPIPAGALVVVPPNLSVADGTVIFLAQARQAYGISADEQHNAEALNTARRNGLFTVSNLQDASSLPASGSILVIAPSKIEGATTAPARILSLRH